MPQPHDNGVLIFVAVLIASLVVGGAIIFFARKQSQLIERDRAAVAATAAAAQADREAVAAERAQAAAELARIAGLDPDTARAELQDQLLAQAQAEADGHIHRIEAKARAEAERRARSVVASTIQRLTGPSSSGQVVTRIALPNEEMKGRIIGKEGRNIRTFETVTGVNVIIDESLASVMVSSFDSERREVAALALQALIEDGRIHPGRIEQAYAEALAGQDERHDAAGHAAAARAGVKGLAKEVIRTLGKLRNRTSYGQNVLDHLVETAQIAALMAGEIGADVELARRGAFLHDIGKALPPGSGPHAEAGAALLKRCGESDLVVNAVAAHHDAVPPETPEAVLVQAADACSASRPGARREDLDQYIERLGRLEEVVTTHAGVKRATAISAGREVRVIVEPDAVSDAELPGLVEAIAEHIEKDLSYPGEIKVTAIRETRASAVAG